MDQGWSGQTGSFGTEAEENVIFSVLELLGVQSGTPEGSLLWMVGGAAPLSHKGRARKLLDRSLERGCDWRYMVGNCLWPVLQARQPVRSP